MNSARLKRISLSFQVLDLVSFVPNTLTDLYSTRDKNHLASGKYTLYRIARYLNCLCPQPTPFETASRADNEEGIAILDKIKQTAIDFGSMFHGPPITAVLEGHLPH